MRRQISRNWASRLSPASPALSNRMQSRYIRALPFVNCLLDVVAASAVPPRVPRLETDHSVPVLTNETLFELESRPERLIVMGAGPAGVEMAQAFQRLGSSVVVRGSRPRGPCTR